jgi:hypothetical protein
MEKCATCILAAKCLVVGGPKNGVLPHGRQVLLCLRCGRVWLFCTKRLPDGGLLEYVGDVRELECCVLLLGRPQAMGSTPTTTELSLRSCPVCVGAKIGEQRTYGVLRRVRLVWNTARDTADTQSAMEYTMLLRLLTRRSGLEPEEEKEVGL